MPGPYALNELWLVLTSNNLGSFDDTDPVFTSKNDASAAADEANRVALHGRSDWVISTLDDAIRERVREAEYSAMSEG